MDYAYFSHFSFKSIPWFRNELLDRLEKRIKKSFINQDISIREKWKMEDYIKKIRKMGISRNHIVICYNLLVK